VSLSNEIETYEFEISENSSIEELKKCLQDRASIPLDSQRLIYGGKQLRNDLALNQYNIQPYATLHLVLRNHGEETSEESPNIPEETAFPSSNQSDEVIRAWESIAETGGFNADVHIVDPQAYYDRLDNLERDVINVSEFRHCGGTYPIGVDYQVPPWCREDTLSDVPAWMWTSLKDISRPPGQQPADDFEASFQQSQAVLASLWKSYLMLCQVLESFSMLRRSKFCKDFFSILLRRTTPKETAEIVKIYPSTQLSSLKKSLEHIIAQILENIEHGAYGETQYLSKMVGGPCSKLLETMGFELPIETRTNQETMDLLQNTMTLLDLALVSYVGSHGSRFDIEFINKDVAYFDVLGASDTALSFRCSRQRLACLNGFLNSREVWVFECYFGSRIVTSVQKGKSSKLLLLTKMDAFADVWGPVWSIPATSGKWKRIKQYNVSNGIIYPLGDKDAIEVDGAVRCHWDNWASFYGRRMTKIFKESEEITIDSDELLLIGGFFQENRECDSKLEDFEEDFEDSLEPLGTRPESWRMDGRGISFGFSKILGVTVFGAQKKVPQTPLKQHILDRWSFDANNANPGMLNLYVGLEISHCTGNARRISVKELLLLESLQPRLECQSPGWRETVWGRQLYRALLDPAPRAVLDLWERFKEYRTEIAELVCCVLKSLSTTGFENDRFTAAVFTRNDESAVVLDHRTNEWCRLLKDSHLMAVFALVSSKCIECHTPTHSAATCHNHKSPTVLQTHISIENHSVTDRIKLIPYGQTLKVDPNDRSDNVWALESGFDKSFSFAMTLNQTLKSGKETLRQPQSNDWLPFYIRASRTDPRRINVLKRRQERILERARWLATSPQIPLMVSSASQPEESSIRANPLQPKPSRSNIVDDTEKYWPYEGGGFDAPVADTQPEGPSIHARSPKPQLSRRDVMNDTEEYQHQRKVAINDPIKASQRFDCSPLPRISRAHRPFREEISNTHPIVRQRTWNPQPPRTSVLPLPIQPTESVQAFPSIMDDMKNYYLASDDEDDAEANFNRRQGESVNHHPSLPRIDHDRLESTTSQSSLSSPRLKRQPNFEGRGL
jgi:hypothetical protein